MLLQLWDGRAGVVDVMGGMAFPCHRKLCMHARARPNSTRLLRAR